MISSYNKTRDMQMRVATLEAVEHSLKHGFLENAKSLGAISKKLEHKIQTYNYTADDARTARVDAIIKKYYAPHL